MTETDIEETTPALDVESILAIHRDPDGFVSFVRKPDPTATPRLDKDGNPYQFENLFCIRADGLRNMFPALAEWLTHDAYMTVNAYYRAAPYTNSITGLPDVWRKEERLRTLTACYTDVDCGRPEVDEPGAALDWRQAQHQIEHLADCGVIPHPSILARSGRGVYALWLLRDVKHPDKLPHAWPEKRELYKACNRALNDRLRLHQLPADIKAVDAARVLRVPGSIHRKAMRRVGYVIQLDERGKGFTYTLPELAAALDVGATQSDLPEHTRSRSQASTYRRTRLVGSAPLRSKGRIALNAQRAQDLLTLEAWRGGFLKRGLQYPDGSTSYGRRFILELYASFLRGSGADPAAALQALRSMAANMHPAYPDPPPDTNPCIENIVAQAYEATKPRRWKNDTLLPLLGITEDVARDLDLKTLIPRTVAIDADRARPLQGDIVKARREWLRIYILEHGGDWTTQKVVNLSAMAPAPFQWRNRQTANTDLNAIGYKVRSCGRRPRKAAR